MSRKKSFCFIILSLLAIVIIIIVVAGLNIMKSRKTPIVISEFIAQGENDDIYLGATFYTKLALRSFTLPLFAISCYNVARRYNCADFGLRGKHFPKIVRTK